MGLGLGVGLGALCQVGRVEITPASISASDADETTTAGALQLCTDALALSNAYMASDFRHSLPRDRIEMDETDGMTFVSGDTRLSIRVCSSMLGRLAVWLHERPRRAHEECRMELRTRAGGDLAPGVVSLQPARCAARSRLQNMNISIG
jgi:hypothetical protein